MHLSKDVMNFSNSAVANLQKKIHSLAKLRSSGLTRADPADYCRRSMSIAEDWTVRGGVQAA